MTQKESLDESESDSSFHQETITDSIRSHLKCYLNDNDLTISEFAEVADLSISTLNTLLYGKSKNCQCDTAIAIARAIGISVDELVNANTFDSTTLKNIQICRSLPDNNVHLIRWFINHQTTLVRQAVHGEKFISIQVAKPVDGRVIKATNNFRQIDISKFNLPNNELNKIFFALQLNSSNYYPIYTKDDIILIANDRLPIFGEHVVVLISDTLFIVEARYIGSKLQFHSIRDGKHRTDESGIDELIGYIVTTVPDVSVAGDR